MCACVCVGSIFEYFLFHLLLLLLLLILLVYAVFLKYSCTLCLCICESNKTSMYAVAAERQRPLLLSLNYSWNYSRLVTVAFLLFLLLLLLLLIWFAWAIKQTSWMRAHTHEKEITDIQWLCTPCMHTAHVSNTPCMTDFRDSYNTRTRFLFEFIVQLKSYPPPSKKCSLNERKIKYKSMKSTTNGNGSMDLIHKWK